MINNDEERYRMTESGVAIHERYTVTLIEAEEAVAMANWLNSHYVLLYAMAHKEQAKEKKEKEATRGQ